MCLCFRKKNGESLDDSIVIVRLDMKIYSRLLEQGVGRLVHQPKHGAEQDASHHHEGKKEFNHWIVVFVLLLVF